MKMITVMLLLLFPFVASAQIYQRIDDEGVVYFSDVKLDEKSKPILSNPRSDAPENKVKSASLKIEVLPIPGKYIYKAVSGADAAIYAVKQTNVKGEYYWYMGQNGSFRATCNGKTVLLEDGVATVLLKNGEVVYRTPLFDTVWLDGSAGYGMYAATIKHANKSLR